MRIAFLSDVPVTAPNGVATSIRSSIKALTMQGCDVRLVAPGRSLSDAVPSVAVPWRDYRASLALPATIGRLCAGVDIVHVHTLGPVGWLGLRAARALDVPAVITWHTDLVKYATWYVDARLGVLASPRAVRAGWSGLQYGRLLFGRPGYQELLREAAHRGINQFDLVIVPSEKTRDQLEAGTQRVLMILPTAVDLALPVHRDPAALRRSLMLPPHARIVLSVGRASPEKNPVLLLEAFARVRSMVPDAVLVMVGHGNRNRSLTRLIDRLGVSSAVRRLPPVDHGSIGSFYLAADLLVFTSQTDTQGLAMVEAEAAGLRVLLVDQQLAGDQTGAVPRTVAVAHPTALSEAIVGLLSKPTVKHGSPMDVTGGQRAFGTALLGAYEACLAGLGSRPVGLRSHRRARPRW